MSLTAMDAKELLRKLEADRNSYLATLQQVADALTNVIATSQTPAQAPASPTAPRHDRVSRLSASDGDASTKEGDSITSPAKTSFISGEDEEASDDDEALYVQDLLAKKTFDDEHLRSHLKNYKWNGYSREILKSLFTVTGRLESPEVFTAKKPAEEGAHYSLYQVFDVGNDGTPLPLHENSTLENVPKDQAVWHLIKDINADTTRLRQAVGRITILREPRPIIFAAIHLAMNELFDMDEIFTHLVQQGTTTAYMKRAYDEDPRKQKSFIFSFEFFTIIGDQCRPMSWQQSDKARMGDEGRIPITRCSSVVALSLASDPIRKLKNSARRAKTKFGYVYSPWAPWHVLNIECYPDWKSNTGSHNSTKHYVNGPEAFLNTLLVEYRDAQKRFEEITQRISKLVTPPADFMFNDGLRDKLLFEDKDFTYSRRYFWAFQTLGTMNQSIKAMVDAYEETFTQAVWEGKHSTLWPLTDETSGRNAYWLKKMSSMKKDFGYEVDRLEGLIDENENLRKEIRDLRDNLFSGTSVLESRKSVEQTEITVQQGQNIKLLTLVNMFFLPLTFVTSVFGMTNMPQEASFWRFGVVMATVCVPFFLLIGSMNTNRGMRFWQEHLRTLMRSFRSWLTWWRQSPRLGSLSNTTSTESNDPKSLRLKERSLSATEGIQERTTQFVSSSEEPDPDPTPLKRAISFGPPISSQPDFNLKKDGEKQDEIDEQRETLNLQAPQLAVIKEGVDAVDEVQRATGSQGVGHLGIWEKFKGRKKASMREYNV